MEEIEVDEKRKKQVYRERRVNVRVLERRNKLGYIDIFYLFIIILYFFQIGEAGRE